MEKKYFIENVFEALDKYNQDVKHYEWTREMSDKYNVPASVFDVGNIFSEKYTSCKTFLYLYC